ncbi:DUF393 domain-containing protein [Pedobacter sp. SYSU D00535]|uniref:DUF393 domain-containing protein n=1 Tax=Pedobacter sp. SYSU D00535 TaxID=2810308 RepID=UPI001A96A02C|nr:DUF393 domain-containing protein [Pedobacter sp. SYSU D00535]
MSRLKNHLILFDADCPMCRLYTEAMVKGGMLDPDGRAPYQDLTEQACPMVDRQRAANEIALVSLESGEVSYGIQSLFKVFASSFPVLKPLFLFKPFVWGMTKLYAFISFNRRVIIPAPLATGTFQIQPSLRLEYRIAYLIFSWFITASIHSAYSPLLKGLAPAGSAVMEYLICGGQVFFQGAIIGLIDRSKRWDYLGNMMSISLAGALLLLPAVFKANWLHLPAGFYAAWFLAIAGAMLLEHIRRTRLLQLGWTLSASWVLYRILVLLFIL